MVKVVVVVVQVVVVLEGSECSESYSSGSGFNDACVQVPYCDLWCCQSNIECSQSSLSVFLQLNTTERYQSCRGSIGTNFMEWTLCFRALWCGEMSDGVRQLSVL